MKDEISKTAKKVETKAEHLGKKISEKSHEIGKKITKKLISEKNDIKRAVQKGAHRVDEALSDKTDGIIKKVKNRFSEAQTYLKDKVCESGMIDCHESKKEAPIKTASTSIKNDNEK